MKRIIRRIICLVLFFAFSLGLVCYTQIRFDNNSIRIQGFYKEERNSIDVIFIGASETYTGYSPTLAYDLYGFTSYVYSIESNSLDLYKYQLEEVKSYQTPKLIVFDLISATSAMQRLRERESEYDAVVRKLTDNMPFSENKIAITKNIGKKGQLASYFIPAIMYHGTDWKFENRAKQNDFDKQGYSYLKGTTSGIPKQIIDKPVRNVLNDDTKKPISPEYQKHLTDFLDYCKEKSYKNIVFTRMPRRIENDYEYDMFCEGNYLASIVRSYGYDVIDFSKLTDEIKIDFANDYSDHAHMNSDGQKKFTEYFGKVLQEQYNIAPSSLSAKSTERWQKSAAYYREYYQYVTHLSEKGESAPLDENSDLLRKLNERS